MLIHLGIPLKVLYKVTIYWIFLQRTGNILGIIKEIVNQIIATTWLQKITSSPKYVWETKLKTARTKLKERARANEIK